MSSLHADHLTITGEERALRLRAVAQARASSRLEGIIVPFEIEELNARYIDGEWSTSEYVEKVIEAADAMAHKSANSKRLSAVT